MSQEELVQAEAIVKNHVIAGAAVGLVPLPYLGLALLTTTQMNMLRRLAVVYDLPFSPEVGRSLLFSFAGSVAPLATAEIVKAIPGIGTLAGGLGSSAFAAASTHAVGKVFIQHFESGGTFLTMNPDNVMEHYREHLAQYRGAETATPAEDYEGVKP